MNARLLRALLLTILSVLSALIPLTFSPAAAQSSAELVGRAVLPATTLTDGPPAGTAVTGPINGVTLPFDSQLAGTFTGLLPGDYAGTWLALTSGQFGSPSNSGDFLLRIYTLELDMRSANGGSGQVSLLDWMQLTDPDGRIGKAIVNEGASARPLTGQDVKPVAFARDSSRAFWVADALGPSLLRFDSYGRLSEAPIPLPGAPQGLSSLPDGSALIVAINNTFNAFDVAGRSLSALGRYDLTASRIGGFAMINAEQAVVIEMDNGENRDARFKQVFAAEVRSGTKTLVADLLNLADPAGISASDAFENAPETFGVGETFKFAFNGISAIYPLNNGSLLIANDNLVPFGKGRNVNIADSTEFILVGLAQPLNVDAALHRRIQ